MTLAPLVPAEPDESVSARVAAICQLKRDFDRELLASAKWHDYDLELQGSALGLTDDAPTKVEGPR